MIPILFYRNPVPYPEGLAIQEQTFKKVASGLWPKGAVIVLQHERVVTLGKHMPSVSLGLHIPVMTTTRGGQATAHEPGQVVVYPILPLKHYNLGPKAYVELLSTSVITTLAQYGISGHIDSKYPGVWVGHQKICAIGVRIKDHITSHGFALNVENSLEGFHSIVPCGILDRGVTSVSKVLGRTQKWSSMGLDSAEELIEFLRNSRMRRHS